MSSGNVSQWETSGRLVMLVAGVLLALGIAGYWFGFPLLARVVADRLPMSAVERLSDQVLETLDRQVFAASALPVARTTAVAERFHRVQWPATATIPMRIEFRKADEMGANALALPAGVIVVTDDLVRLAKNDDEIIAVLAHEAGHVQERHGLRSLIQSSFVSLLVTWIVGDVGSLIAVAPTVLLASKYSRDLERAADAYAADTLTANGLSTGLLADMLARMETERSASGAGRPAAMSYLSSHPATEERIAALRR